MMSWRLLRAAVAIAAMVVAFGASSAPAPPGQGASIGFAPPARTAAASLTATDAETWLDGLMPYALRQADIAGAVVVIVKDGDILLQKGYGFADVTRRTPVDPARTLFRPASISKLVTATAVMQLVEAGKLDLDADVNRYLDIRIPPRDGDPVTLRQLLKHTAGFEEKLKVRAVTDDRRIISLAQFVGGWVPTRIFDPGTTPAYSNYGAAVAGRIVERVSGQPFEDYVASHILAPLGMRTASFRQPLPPALAAAMSHGYDTASEPAKPYEFYSDLPAGSLTASGTDMARFMIAHLQNGRLGTIRILRPETAMAMHNSVTWPTTGLNGMALGFYEQSINGHRVLAHAGDLLWFHSNLALFIDDDVGIYISLNSAGRDNGEIPITSLIRRQFFEGFADRYFPQAAPGAGVDPATAKAHAALVAGRYMASRRAQSNFLAIGNLIGQLDVGADGDGGIRLRGERFIEIAPFTWRAVDGHGRWAATLVDGKVTRLGSDAPYNVYDRVPRAIDAAWLLPTGSVALALLLVTAVSWPVAALARRHYGASFALRGRRAMAHRLVRLAALVMCLAVGTWIVLLALLEDSEIAGRPLDAIILTAQALTMIGGIGGVAAALYNLWQVWRGPAPWRSRVWSVLLVAAFVVLVWISANYALLGFNTQF